MKTIKRNTRVRVIRDEINTAVANAIGPFYFHNAGVVKQIFDGRAKVVWGKTAFWFDLEALTIDAETVQA